VLIVDRADRLELVIWQRCQGIDPTEKTIPDAHECKTAKNHRLRTPLNAERAPY